MVGPPVASRFLVVGSDARLRCCVVPERGGARVWADYDVTTAPNDLPLRAVLDSLSTLIASMERTVTQMEIRQITRDAELDSDIAASKARIAGLPDLPVRSAGVKRDVASEEPVRPWMRHSVAARRAAETARAATREALVKETPGVAPEVMAPEVVAPEVVAPEGVTPATAPVPEATEVEDIFVVAPTPDEVTPAAAPAPEAPPARKGFRLSRLDKAL
jgi:hypothetical protein